jgi:hypothetical protein
MHKVERVSDMPRGIQSERRCPRCGKYKALAEFRCYKGKPSGYCTVCGQEYQRLRMRAKRREHKLLAEQLAELDELAGAGVRASGPSVDAFLTPAERTWYALLSTLMEAAEVGRSTLGTRPKPPLPAVAGLERSQRSLGEARYALYRRARRRARANGVEWLSPELGDATA